MAPTPSTDRRFDRQGRWHRRDLRGRHRNPGPVVGLVLGLVAAAVGVLILGVSVAEGRPGPASDGPQTGAVIVTFPEERG